MEKLLTDFTLVSPIIAIVLGYYFGSKSVFTRSKGWLFVLAGIVIWFAFAIPHSSNDPISGSSGFGLILQIFILGVWFIFGISYLVGTFVRSKKLKNNTIIK